MHIDLSVSLAMCSVTFASGYWPCDYRQFIPLAVSWRSFTRWVDRSLRRAWRLKSHREHLLFALWYLQVSTRRKIMSGQQCVSQIRAMSMEVSPRPPQSRAGRVRGGLRRVSCCVDRVALPCIARHSSTSHCIAGQRIVHCRRHHGYFAPGLCSKRVSALFGKEKKL